MRRTVPIILATVCGLVLLFNFKTSPGSTVLSTPAESRSTASPATSSPPAGASPNGAGSLSPPSTVRPPAPTTTAPITSNATRVINGPVEENRYGPVQVRVTLSGGRIVDVEPLQLPSDRSRSIEINDVAGPRLKQEALQAQSAQIHTISGATYTSIGYRQSLQAALDQAGHR